VEVLSGRALNRATLDRQLLLERSPLDPLSAIEHLVGLQAQVPTNPHVALWSRLEGFTTSQLDALLVERRVVRSAALRGTIHVLSGPDCLAIWPLEQPVLEQELRNHRDFAPLLRGVDLDPPTEWARRYLDEPRTQPQLKSALGDRFPELDPAALAFVCRNRLALVQVPPRGLWGRSNQVTVTTLEAWLGESLDRSLVPADLVARYLAAFGPARPADMATWSRLTGLSSAFDAIRGDLVEFADQRGRAHFDVANAPRPDPSTPAPVRFLPEYDNLLLAHADRARFFDRDVSALYPPGRLGRGHVLVDGMVRGTWIVGNGRLEVLHLELPRRDRDEVRHVATELSALLELEREPDLSGVD
jgi:DNA glycosylase AlkZ-like